MKWNRKEARGILIVGGIAVAVLLYLLSFSSVFAYHGHEEEKEYKYWPRCGQCAPEDRQDDEGYCHVDPNSDYYKKFIAPKLKEKNHE